MEHDVGASKRCAEAVGLEHIDGDELDTESFERGAVFVVGGPHADASGLKLVDQVASHEATGSRDRGEHGPGHYVL